MLILLKKYISTICFQIVLKYYIFHANFHIMFVLFSNISIHFVLNLIQIF